MICFPEVRALARALAAVVLSFGAVVASPAVAATLTISDVAFSGDQTLCPRADAAAPTPIPVNAFQVAGATGTIARVQLKLLPAGAYASLERVEIRSDDLGTLYGSVIPNADLFWMNLSVPLPVAAGGTPYKITIAPRRHADMPPPAVGKAVPVQVQLVSALSGGNVVTGSDLASATVTIDNLAPANVLWSGVTSGAAIALNWAAAADVVVLKREFAPVEDVPVEGATYASNTTYGTSQVAFVGNAAGYSDAAVTAGRAYYYRVFTRSSPCSNYSTGSALGPVFAGGTSEGDATPNSTKPVVGIVSPASGPVTRPFKVLIRVFSPGSLPITEVRVYGNQSGTEQLLGTSIGASPLVTRNGNYDTGAPDPASGFFEFTAPAGLAAGTWTLRAWAANVAGPSIPVVNGVYSGAVGVVAGADVGDGRLLVRDNSSQLCADCHQVKTHSSEAVGMGLGSWYIGCRGCHDPHGTTNAKLIAKEVTPPAYAGAQAPQAVVYKKPGNETNAQGTGLCQVCHTRTQFYQRGAQSQTHGDGQTCATCHKHTQGLGASCSACHGDPSRNVPGGDSMQSAAPPRGAPPGYATAPSSNAVGKHVAHVTGTTFRTAAIQCGNCHQMPNVHNGTVDAPTFPQVNGVATGGIWAAGTSTCSSTYCHGGPSDRNFQGTNRTPSWTAATAPLDCQSCHLSPPGGTHTTDPNCSTCHGTGYALTGITGPARDTHIDGQVQATNCTGCHGTPGVNAAPPVAAAPVDPNNVGAHQAHLTKTDFRTSALGCPDCHKNFPVGHANGSEDVAIGALGTANGMGAATYQGVATPANPTCTSTYCHAGAPGGSTPAPNWNTAGTLGCNSCHANSPGYPHPGNQTCGDCHPASGGESYTKTGATSGTVARATHLDAQVTKSTSGCTSCHGTLTASGVSLVANTVKAAPGYDVGSEDTLGGTATAAPAVGAHRTHLTAAGIRPVGAAVCTDCHVLPPTDADTAHATGAGTGGARATVDFTHGFGNFGGQVGGYSSSTSATTNATAGNCANTYCHGGKYTTAAYQGATPAPSWTGGPMSCGSCHQAPPSTGAHLNVTATRNCGDCHSGYDCTTGNLAACTVDALHLDGVFEPATVSCSSCHGNATVVARTTLGTIDAKLAAAPPKDAAGLSGTNQVGPHQGHVNPSQVSQIYKPVGCSECHGSAVNLYSTLHTNGIVEVTFANATGANLRGFSPGQTLGNPWSCNTYCHDNPNGTGGSVASWTWNTTTTVTCGSCHGSPPPDARHVSVGTNQTPDKCNACHNATVAPGGTIIFTGSGAAATTLHINGVADLGSGVTCHSCHGSATNNAPPVAANAANGNAVGAHQSHVLSGRTIASALACTNCHPAVGATAYNHANGTVAMSFAGAGAGTAWNPATPATSSCSLSWCHGGTATQAGWGRANTDPLWNAATGTFNKCNSCHGAVPPIAVHHPQNTTNPCSTCHGAGYTTGGISGAALGTHVNGTVEPRTGCTACHGDLSAGSGTLSGAAAAAPGYNGVGVDSHGNGAVTVRTVGAHDAHVRGTSFRPTSLPCTECHFDAVPANGDVTHADGVVAPLTGGPLATDTSLSTTPTLTWNGSTCANTYCHGNFKNGNNVTMTWAQNTTLDCNSCHGRGTGATATPPGGNHPNRTDCASCHPDYTVVANRGTHLDGNLDLVNMTCASCHGTTRSPNAGIAGVADPNLSGAPPLDTAGQSNTVQVGPHQAHVNPVSTAQIYLPVHCTECHGAAVDSYTLSHSGNGVDVIWTAAVRANQGGIASWTQGTPDPLVNAGSCTTYCHGDSLPLEFKGSITAAGPWRWDTTTNAGCGSCHGLPPDAGVGGTHEGVAASATACNTCHAETVDPTGKIIFTGSGASATTKHINGQIDGGESKGALACTGCHGDIYTAMNAGSLHRHQMTGTTTAPGPTNSVATLGAYPTAATAATCVQCHVDHNIFRPDVNAAGARARNLRLTATAQPTAANGQNTDHSGTTGLCVSCHASAQTKATGLPDAGATTPVIDGTAFGNSPHDYATAGATFKDGTSFQANCSKCHDDTSAKKFQSGAGDQFSLHASTEPSVLSTLATGAREEGFCYRCHSTAVSASQDYYGAASMTSTSKDVYTQMQKGTGGSAPTQAATTLYFRPAGTNALDGPKPGVFLLASGTYAGTTTFAEYDIALAAGTATTTKTQTSGTLTNRYLHMGQFVSPPVATAVTIPAGSTFQVKTRASISVAGDTENERFQIWKRTAGGVNTALSTATQENGTALTTTATNRTYSFITNTAVTLNPGDGLILEIETRKSSATSSTVTESFGLYSTDQASLVLPVSVTFQSGAASVASARHDVGAYSGLHKPVETRADLAASKHVECADCHDPHEAKPGLHIATTYTTAASATLYFRNVNTVNAVSNRPSAYAYSSGSYTTNNFNQEDMAPTVGSTSTTAVISTGNLAARYNRGVQFVSPQLDNTVTITSGSAFTFTLNEIRQNLGPSTDYTRVALYKWNGATATPFNTANFVQNATAIPTTTASRVTTVTSNQSVTLNPGDVIVADVEFYHQTGTTTQNVTYTYGNNSGTLALPAGTYNWRTGSTFTRVALAGVLTGATGVGVTTWGSTNWSGVASAAFNPSSTTAALPAATAEWQVCFKCHASANANLLGTTSPGWNTGRASGTEFTDLALEFNPNNQSYHPVVQALPATDPGVNGSSRLDATQLIGSDQTWTPGQTMTCTDCHNADAASPAAQGPHGSAIRYMLAGTNKAWPYTVAGATSGTLFRVATADTGSGTTNGLFCLNCHPSPQSSSNTNAFHQSGDVRGGEHGGSAIMSCVRCHIRVPHGGKVSRLIVTTNAPARYQVSGQTPNFDNFRKGANKGSYSSSISSYFDSSCSHHGSTLTNAEAW